MRAYYNEIDPFAAAWLRELIKEQLIADGEVDERSIELVQPGDLAGFTQCHFFAGIGGWSYALRLAGWPDDREVWTASSPCQPLSSAARGRLVAPDLRRAWLSLVAESAPCTIFGEQVVNERWASALLFDLEYLGYEVGASVLSAYSVGFDHARERFYFVGNPNGDCQSGLSVDDKVAGLQGDRGKRRDLGATHGLSRDVVALSGFGNAIVPQVAQVFIESYLDCERHA